MSSRNGLVSSSRQSLRSHDRKLRYRALLEDLSNLELDITNDDERMQKTESAVQEAKALLADGGIEERVKHPGEGYLDSRVLRATSDLAVRYSESISGNVNTYDRLELAQHIKDHPEFWSLTFPREVPTLSYLFGTFAPTPPEQRVRAPRRRAERQQLAELTAPENVEQLQKQEEGSELVTRVNRFIKKTYKQNGGCPLSYFHVALDPDSFSRTVENIYLISFLVKDGLVAIDIDEEYGLPFITPMPDSNQEAHDISSENQFVVSIDTQRWQELVQAFNIRKPMMTIKRLT